MLTTREEEFLARARDADEQAEKAKDPQVKETLRMIADGYRQLAAYKRLHVL